jgi:poly-gamma-glutamate synthase PgsB/CapB
MWLVFLLLGILIAYGLFEYRRHYYHIHRIPNRIHVNGTRGKSSVTRLIGGGLKGADNRVFIKTTGTKPRTISVDGIERPIHRVGKANIIEQLKVVRDAVAQKAEYIVIECMAVQPDLQYLTERQMIYSTVGVITNARADHLDVMGPTVADVAESLCNSLPRKGVVYTTEYNHLDIIKRRAARLNTEVKYIDPETVDNDTMRGFSYLEHKSNVALALAVCRHFGVDKEKALRGMYSIQPDPGVLHKYAIQINGKSLEFINAFAANDPESYKAIWEMLHIHREPGMKLIVLVNSRRDRVQRAEQLGEFIASSLEADFFVVSGEYTHALVHKAIHCGLPAANIKDLGGHSAEQVFNFIAGITEKNALVVGIGNIVGLGEEIVNHFVSKGRMIA